MFRFSFRSALFAAIGIAGLCVSVVTGGQFFLLARGQHRSKMKSNPMIMIQAGCFTMGQKGSGADAPPHKVCLSAYRIDQDEVTVKQYRSCFVSSFCSRPIPHNPNHWDYSRCNWGLMSRTGHPINCVTWRQAKTYCRWVKKRLPTEAEWEYAARGAKGRPFPWGNRVATCMRAVITDMNARPSITRRPPWINPLVYQIGGSRFWKRGIGCGRHTTWPIGSKPKGNTPSGIRGLGGNVSEWVEDCYHQNFYSRCKGCRDPVNKAKSCSWRVVRGGAWSLDHHNVNSTLRNCSDPANLKYPGFRKIGPSIGFRCAASVKKPRS